MKKIRLNTDELEVHSFSTAQAPQARGTIQGAASGYTCYVTVAYYQTRCLAYPVSYWGENTCTCPIEPATQNLQCQVLTDFTCLGQPGC